MNPPILGYILVLIVVLLTIKWRLRSGKNPRILIFTCLVGLVVSTFLSITMYMPLTDRSEWLIHYSSMVFDISVASLLINVLIPNKCARIRDQSNVRYYLKQILLFLILIALAAPIYNYTQGIRGHGHGLTKSIWHLH